MAQVEGGFRKTVVTKEDGRYIIFYDFAETAGKTDRRKKEERSRRNDAERK